MGASRRAFLRGAVALGSGLALGGAAVVTGAQPALAVRSGFSWCRRCQGLWFHGGGNNGHCPVSHLFDHSHYRDGSFCYVLETSFEPGNGQSGWHWCRDCKGVYFFSLSDGSGYCPNNPLGSQRGHTNGDLLTNPGNTDFASFRVEHDGANNGAGAQQGWRFCRNCNGLYFVLNGISLTHCPRGGTHIETATFHYGMRFAGSEPNCG